MNKRVLILHGWQNTRPNAHWQFWLAEELRRRRIPVAYPQLPEPEQPSLNSWLNVLGKELEMLGDGERIVVCHSLSCMLWLHAANRNLNHGAATRVLFVAPPGIEAFTQDIADFVPTDFARERIAASSHEKIQLMCSTDDPYCVGGAAQRYGAALDLECEVIPNAGHLSTDDGYGPWPRVLEWVLN